jgi:ribonuclease-3
VSEPIEDLYLALDYRFEDPALASTALSHPSHTHELDGTRGNERLEFLGDAVLDLVVAEMLYQRHPDWKEGQLTRARASMVNKRALARRARRLGLDELVQLGKTERRGSSRTSSVRPSTTIRSPRMPRRPFRNGHTPSCA